MEEGNSVYLSIFGLLLYPNFFMLSTLSTDTVHIRPNTSGGQGNTSKQSLLDYALVLLNSEFKKKHYFSKESGNNCTSILDHKTFHRHTTTKTCSAVVL